MAEPKYRGYSGKSDALKTAISASGEYAKYSTKAQSAKDDEEEKKQRKQAGERLKEQYKKEGKNEDGTNKSLLDQAGGLLGGVGSAIGSAADEVGKSFNRGTILKDAADLALGSTAKGINTAIGGIGEAGSSLSDELAKLVYSGEKEKRVLEESAKGRKSLEDNILNNGLLGKGSYLTKEDIRKGSAGDALRKGISAGGDIAQELAPGGATVRGAKIGARIGSEALASGLSSAAGGSVRELTDNQDGFDVGRVAGETALGSVLGGAGSAVGGLAGKAARKLTGKGADKTASVAASEAQKALESGAVVDKPQKRLGESTDAYEQRITELDQEAERIRNGDYSGLTNSEKTNPGKKGTTVTTQDPKQVQAQTEAARAADEAEQEVKRLNDMKLASPFHRQLDKINAAKQQELDQLDEMSQDPSFPPQAIESARADVEARYAPQVKEVTQKYLTNPKYAQDVMDSPALEDSLKNATQAQMDAEAELERISQEQFNAVGKLGAADTVETPDPQKILGRLKEIDDEKATVAEQKAQAEQRRTTYGDLEGTQKELADLNSGNFSQEDHPELFNEDGTQDNAARIKRVKELRAEGTETKTRTTLIDEVGTSKKASKVAEENPEVKEALDAETNDIDSLLVDANPDYKPGIGAWASSAARVYEKAGLGKVINKVRDGHDAMVKENSAVAEQLQTWWKDIGRDKATSENIGRYLNGESVSLGDEAQRVADEMKAYYRKVADDLDLAPESRISDYFPHIFSDKALADKLSAARQKLDDSETSPQARAAAQKQFDRLQEQFLKTSDPDFQRILDKNPGANVNFGNLKKREFNQDGFSYDAFKVFDTYTRRANSKIFMEPGLQAMQAAQKEVSTKMSDYIGKHMNLIKNNGAARSELTEALDTTLQKAGFKPGSFERGSDIARTLVYNGTLGGNVGSAIRNSTQMTNTYALAGEKHVAIGTAQAIQALTNKGMQEELKNAGILSDSLTRALTGDEGTFKTGVAKGAENAQKAIWAMFDTTEKLNRAGAFYAGKSKALAAGKSEKEAVQAGKAMARKTQFNSTVVDNPIGFSGPVAKNFLQLASYNVKQVEFIKDLVVGGEGMFTKGKDGKYQLSPQGALNLARFVGGSAANLAILGPLVGLTATQMVPFLQEFGDGEVYQSPLVQIALGKQDSKTGIANIISGKDKYGEDADRGKVFQDFLGDTAPTLLPGGTQIKKTLDNERNNQLGYSATDSGNIRFSVDGNTGDRIKGGLLGQYTTGPGQQYIKDIGKKEDGVLTGGSLTKSASEKIKSAPVQDRPEMETFYRAAKTVTGRDKANDKVTELFSNGEPEKARRYASEFNAKVDAKMGNYYSQYPDMDEDLLDELNSNLYIKLTPRSEKQRSK